jgi:predicted aspartyl protease
MKSIKLLKFLLIAVLAIWGTQIFYTLSQNSSTPSRIKSKANGERNQIAMKHKQQLSELQSEYDRKKHLATGQTVFDRIFNKKDQTVTELIKGISKEALPDGWTCDVKVEEFTHFVLLIYLPHNAEPLPFDQITESLRPIVEYCAWCLSNVAVFDRKHKSYLFLDKTILARLKNEESFTKKEADSVAEQGSAFTRFNSVTVDCETYESHLLVPVEISGPNGIIGCRALLDTGASVTMLSSEIISETGWDDLQTAPRRTFSTVNGTISCPIVRREVNIAGVRKNIEVAVNQRDNLSLIGMNFFSETDYIVDSRNSAIYIWEK